MSATEIATKRRLAVATDELIRTNDPKALLQQLAIVLDSLGTLMSMWTGETVRLRMTAEGQTENLDLSKRCNEPNQ